MGEKRMTALIASRAATKLVEAYMERETDMKAEIETLRAENARLREALDESVKLQSHYALLLNTWDGGERISFKSTDAWLVDGSCAYRNRPESPRGGE